ncbi:MAG: hypothetical protein FJ100_11885 [Deltaproteobacteria bacterium]|nr:hypothetical protein [Deltaproteobacteria bacterium]
MAVCAAWLGCARPTPASVAADAPDGEADQVGASEAIAVADAVRSPTDAKDAVQPSADATAAQDATATASDSHNCPFPTEPGPDADVGQVPEPAAWSCPTDPPEFFKGNAPPPATLAIEVGAVKPDGAFKVYKDGVWVPMVHGPQGGFHIYAGVRVQLPGATMPKAKLQVEARLWDGCKIVGYGVAPVSYGGLQPGSKPPTYVVGESAMPGTLVIFDDGGTGVKSTQSWYYCNRWYDLRVAVRDVLTGAWAQSQVRVRTYDTAKHQ